MLCENCGKKDASVHITEIINGKAIEMHLCEECAKEKGVVSTQPFSMADLLAGMVDFDAEVGGEERRGCEACPNCGMTFEDFRKTGRFGCAQCYETFKDIVSPLLQKIHGSMHHFGKLPKKNSVGAKKGNKIQQLKERLKAAIEKEEFEEAARLRDKIKETQRKKND